MFDFKIKMFFILFLTMIAFFVAGRYSVPIQEKTEVKVTDKQKDTHKETTIVKDPSGREVTTIIEDSKSETLTKKEETLKIDAKPKWNFSGVAGTDIHSLKPVYGGIIQHEFIGPVNLGVVGLTNGFVGVSLGFNY